MSKYFDFLSMGVFDRHVGLNDGIQRAPMCSKYHIIFDKCMSFLKPATGTFFFTSNANVR